MKKKNEGKVVYKFTPKLILIIIQKIFFLKSMKYLFLNQLSREQVISIKDKYML